MKKKIQKSTNKYYEYYLIKIIFNLKMNKNKNKMAMIFL